MSITRTELLGKRVYNPDASLVGEVSDIGFAVGTSAPSMVVKLADGSTTEISWGDVEAAKDMVLLKVAVDLSRVRRTPTVVLTPDSQAQPVAQVQPQGAQGPQPGEKKFCPSCGKELTWIAQYRRWYCYKEKRYA